MTEFWKWDHVIRICTSSFPFFKIQIVLFWAKTPHTTGCGRKNSPIWEENKFKTKEDTANVFLFLESTQNAVLQQCILNKSSLKWWPGILIHWCSLSVVVHELENHFRCNGSNFLSYRLLQSFQRLSCLSKVWYPTVNRILIRNSLPSTKRKADAKCTLCCYRRPAIFL